MEFAAEAYASAGTILTSENCVFFAQQSVEKRSICLWVGRFFIARGGPFGNFTTATEGGIPRSRFPGRRIAPRKTQVTKFCPALGGQGGVRSFSGKRGARGSSNRCCRTGRIRNPLTTKQRFGGSR